RLDVGAGGEEALELRVQAEVQPQAQVRVRDAVEQPGVAGVGVQRDRLGSGEQDVDLGPGQPVVQRDEHRAGLGAGQHDLHVAVRVEGEHGDPVAVPDVCPAQ